jgi:hypothetical protein
MKLAPKLPTTTTVQSSWYYASEGHSKGPYSTEQMFELSQEGVITDDTLVWEPSRTQWNSVIATAPGWRPVPAAPPTRAHAEPLLPTAVVLPPILSEMPTQATPETRLKPQAPSQTEPQPQKTSFLRRLFGRR